MDLNSYQEKLGCIYHFDCQFQAVTVAAPIL